MMQDISYSPKRKNHVVEWVMTGTAAVAVLCAVFLMAEWGRPLIFQSILVLAGVAMIFVATRYLTMSYVYTVSEETNLFIVVARQGRRLTTLCRLSLSALYHVRPYEDGDKKESSKTSRYSYCVTPHPPASLLLFFNDGEHIVSVRIEADSVFTDCLSQVAQRNAVRNLEETEKETEDESEDE